MSFFQPQNPGIGGLDELTTSEETVIQSITSLGTAGQVLAVNAGATGVEWVAAGAGNVTKVGTPANNQVGVWTGDGTIEGDSTLTYDGATLDVPDVTVDTEVYGVSWDGNSEVPTKNDVYDKIESLTPANSITWSEVTGTSQAGAINSGYILNNAALVTLTLPDTAALGSIIKIVGKGAGGWLLAQNASENINFGNITTTTGVGGSLASTHRYDCLEIVCTVANTTWTVTSAQTAGLTYV